MKSSSNKGKSSAKSTKSTSKSTRARQNQTPEQNESLKLEIANEFGVKLGADATARQNGKVGGEITKRLVKLGQNNMDSSSK